MLCLLLSIEVHNDCKTLNEQKHVTEAKFYPIRLNIAFFTLWDYHNLNGHVLFQKSELNKDIFIIVHFAPFRKSAICSVLYFFISEHV